MKKIRKEKLSLQKATITELNNTQMIRIYGGTDSDTITTDDNTTTTTTQSDPSVNPRNTYTTCSSKFPSRGI